MKLTFSDNIPAATTKLLKKIMKHYEPLCTRAMNEILFSFETDSDVAGDVVAAISTTREYKFAEIRVFAKFLTLAEEDAEEVIVHELMHTLTAPMRDEAFRLIEYYVPEPMQNYVGEIMQEKEELAVVELAKTLVDFRRGRE